MPKVDAGLACPLCDLLGITSRLYQVTPSLAVYCESGRDSHMWTDTSILRELNPRRLPVAPRAETIQTNHVTLTLRVPMRLEAALRARYGDALSASVTSVLQACTEGEMLFLNETDLQRIKDRTGLKPSSSTELFGHFYAMGEQINDLKSEIERLKRAAAIQRRGGSPDGVAIDLGDQLGKATEKANESGCELEEFIGNYVRMSLENDWITGNA